METYVILQVILLIAVVSATDDVDDIEIPLPKDIEPSTSSTTEDSKLVIGLGNDRGQLKRIEISKSDIPRANLSSLVEWLRYVDELKSFLLSLKAKNTEAYDVRAIGPTGEDMDPELPMPEKLDKSIKTVEEFEQKMETELRKPEKDWNYSVEKSEDGNQT